MSDVSSPLATAITIGLVETSLTGATVVRPSTPVRSAINQLRRGHFDQAPVMQDGKPVGYVLASDLLTARGRVESCVCDILPNSLVSADTPFGIVVPWLAEGGFLFILRERRVSGFVVPSDVNKQAGRAFFFLVLTEFELALAAAVRMEFPDQEVLLDADILGKDELAKVRGRRHRHIAKNLEADVVAEFDLQHLCLAAGSSPVLRGRLEDATGQNWSSARKLLQPLRNAVAHSNKGMLSEITMGDAAYATAMTEAMTSVLTVEQ